MRETGAVLLLLGRLFQSYSIETALRHFHLSSTHAHSASITEAHIHLFGFILVIIKPLLFIVTDASLCFSIDLPPSHLSVCVLLLSHLLLLTGICVKAFELQQKN